MIGRWCGCDASHRRASPFTFIPRRGFDTRALAYMLDSLVRVSRRVGGRHFVRHREDTFTSVGGAARGPGFQAPARADGPPRSRPPAPPTDADIGRACQARPLLPAAASLLAISSPLHSLFKVLFIFPSRYLFAIGLLLIFSFRRNLPPTLGCTRKQPDSLDKRRTCRAGARTGLSPSAVPHSMGVVPGGSTGASPLDYNSATEADQF